MRGQPHVLQSTLALFAAMQKRFRTVEIDNRDFAAVMERHQGPRTLFYVDPPYLGVEDYYRQVDGARFGLADHERLAALLNATASLVVLSSYEHPKLSEWYPETKWRWVRWQTVKHSQRTKATHERVTEVLLCNYPAPAPSLWTSSERVELLENVTMSKGC